MKRLESNGTFRILPFTNATGTTSYRVTGWFNGKRIRQNFPNEGEALTVKGNFERQVLNLPPVALITTDRVTLDQAGEAAACFRRLEGSGLTLTMAVDYALANFKAAGKSLTVAKAVDQFIQEKEAMNLRPRTIESLTSRVGALKKAHGELLVNVITSEQLRPLIFRDGSGLFNQRSDYVALTNFFNWALVQGFCAVSPMVKIQPISVEVPEPEILPLAQVRKLVAAAQGYKEGRLVPYIALGLFCAIRPAEIARLDWSAIDDESWQVVIGAKLAKMRGRRSVDIAANARELIKPFMLAKVPFVSVNWRRDLDAVKVLAGLQDWPQDVLRHTGISYHLALHQHEGKTAGWAGNSPDVIQKHYKGLVKAKDVAGFWAIGLPEPKLTALPLAKAA